MFKKEFFVALGIVFVSIGFTFTAFAENREKTAVGTDEFSFNAPKTAADNAAENYVYDQEKLAKIGSEAGNWEFDFNAPKNSADLAAQNYVYDYQRLQRIGTEAGDREWQFGSSSQSSNPPYVKEEVKADNNKG